MNIDKYLQRGEGNANDNQEVYFSDEHIFYHCNYASALIKINELIDIYKKKENKTNHPALKYGFLKPFDLTNFLGMV